MCNNLLDCYKFPIAVRSSYGVESNVLHNFLYRDIFKFFLFVPIRIYSPPANCTGCFSAQEISISTTILSPIGTLKNRKFIIGESILESHASNSLFPFFILRY